MMPKTGKNYAFSILLPHNTNVYYSYRSNGHVKGIVLLLSQMGYSPVIPTDIFSKNKPVIERYLRTLLKGYIFFEAKDQTEQDWKRISNLQKGVIPLHYCDKQKELKNTDLFFYEWLKCFDFIISSTLVHTVGTKIEPEQGPLLSLKKDIVSVNKHRLVMQIAGGGVGSHFQNIWFPFEYAGTNKINEQ